MVPALVLVAPESEVEHGVDEVLGDVAGGAVLDAVLVQHQQVEPRLGVGVVAEEVDLLAPEQPGAQFNRKILA